MMGKWWKPGETFGLWAIFWSFGGSPGSPEVAEKTKKTLSLKVLKNITFSRIYDGGRQKLPSQSFEDQFFTFWTFGPCRAASSPAHDGFVPEPIMVKYKKCRKILGISGK